MSFYNRSDHFGLKRKWRRKKEEGMKKISRKEVIVCLLGMGLARVSFFGVYPALVSYFAAASIQMQEKWLLLLAIYLGMGTKLAGMVLAKYSLILLTVFVVLLFAQKKEKKMPIVSAGLLASVVTAIFDCTKGLCEVKAEPMLLLALLEALAVFSFTMVFQSGVEWLLSEKKQKQKNEAMISLSMICACCIYALPDLSGRWYSFVQIGVFFLISYFGYGNGAGAAAICGAFCGALLGWQEGQTVASVFSNAGLLCMLGILTGFFQVKKKYFFALWYTVCACCLTFLAKGNQPDIEKWSAIFASLVLFLAIPVRQRFSLLKEKQEHFFEANLQKIAQEKLNGFSESFYQLSKTFQAISEPRRTSHEMESHSLFASISDRICKSCERCEHCWKQKFQDTYQATSQLIYIAKEQGVVKERDIPLAFAGQCIHFSEWLMELNYTAKLEKMNWSWKNRMAESREAIAGQLREVSHLISDFSKELYGRFVVSDQRADEIVYQLRKYQISVNDIAVLEQKNKKQEIYMTAHMKKGHCVTTKEMAEWVSQAFGKRMRPSDRTKNIISKEEDLFVFEEDTNFKVLTGIARVAKEKEIVSGDNFSFLSRSTGELVMTLSDGMGSGKAACTESKSVVELLEEFMEAGFKEESAIQLINSILVLKSEEQTFSTIDLGILNLFTGVCQFVKIGAATTFIKRDRLVESIRSMTIPVGMFNKVDFDGVRKKLYDGDFIIMVTDGVLDSRNGEHIEAEMEQFLLQLETKNPQEMAEAILQKALEQNPEHILDDMTVLVAGIWKK